mmetsp:Transcript_2623/g.7508  ORF Transcript_2623/g.7508 Transcript_2623/m.7508 type:complete len:447 (-) Transcript_2623:1252-2592(-)
MMREWNLGWDCFCAKALSTCVQTKAMPQPGEGQGIVIPLLRARLTKVAFSRHIYNENDDRWEERYVDELQVHYVMDFGLTLEFSIFYRRNGPNRHKGKAAKLSKDYRGPLSWQAFDRGEDMKRCFVRVDAQFLEDIFAEPRANLVPDGLGSLMDRQSALQHFAKVIWGDDAPRDLKVHVHSHVCDFFPVDRDQCQDFDFNLDVTHAAPAAGVQKQIHNATHKLVAPPARGGAGGAGGSGEGLPIAHLHACRVPGFPTRDPPTHVPPASTSLAGATTAPHVQRQAVQAVPAIPIATRDGGPPSDTVLTGVLQGLTDELTTFAQRLTDTVVDGLMRMGQASSDRTVDGLLQMSQANNRMMSETLLEATRIHARAAEQQHQALLACLTERRPHGQTLEGIDAGRRHDGAHVHPTPPRPRPQTQQVTHGSDGLLHARKETGPRGPPGQDQ